MCSGLIHQKLPADKVLSGVIVLDFDGPKFYQYSQLGKTGLKNLQAANDAFICKFRGYRAKLILKIKRLRKAFYFPDLSRLSKAA